MGFIPSGASQMKELELPMVGKRLADAHKEELGHQPERTDGDAAAAT